jgi:transcriptional regulator with XRE-family HTH domain
MVSKLKSIRLSKQLKQIDIAERVGVNSCVISTAESRINPPKLELQIKLAQALDMGLDELQRACEWPVIVIPQSSKAGGIR